MKEIHFGIIGAGSMGSAILQGALNGNVMSPQQIWLANPHQDKLTPFGDKGVHTTTSNVEAAENVDILLLAVKPQKLPDVLKEIAVYTAGKCIVSIAAGMSRRWLMEQLPQAHIVCVMPNTPLMLGCGAIAVTQRYDVPEGYYDAVMRIFSATGLVRVLPEEQMNDIIPVSGSSPAFFFRMASVMTDAAVKRGMDSETALLMAAKTMEGAARMLLESGRTAAELEKQVCSPGGTTLAALTAFDEKDFAGMMDEAFERCIRRAEELGR